MAKADEIRRELAAAGWSMGEYACTTSEGVNYVVDGANGENVVIAREKSSDAAWKNAAHQAAALGMLRSRQDEGADSPCPRRP